MPIVPEAFIPAVARAVVELKEFAYSHDDADHGPGDLLYGSIEALEEALASVPGHHDVSDLYEDAHALTPERKAELRLISSEGYVRDVEKVTKYMDPIDLRPDGPEIGYLREYCTGSGPRTKAIPLSWMAM
jgi:hypothetical protein